LKSAHTGFKIPDGRLVLDVGQRPFWNWGRKAFMSRLSPGAGKGSARSTVARSNLRPRDASFSTDRETHPGRRLPWPCYGMSFCRFKYLHFNVLGNQPGS
jgi:hypothetical protein